MYPLLRRIFFRFDPESVHHFSMSSFKKLCSNPFTKAILKGMFSPKSVVNKPYYAFGLTFKNKVGLAAGFDKNAEYLRELEVLGFGYVEIGTVTPLAQPGNEQPRVFRLPQDKALINRMGFNNEGVKVVAERLKKWKQKNAHKRKNKLPLIVGGNIGKNKITPNEDAWKDYEICFKELHPYVDYFVVNVSSPNTPGLRELQEKESLRKILTHLQQLNKGYEIQRPVLLKIAPDLTAGQIDDVIDLATEINLDGLVVTNTTISRDGLTTEKSSVEAMGAGGLSGVPLRLKSTKILRYISQKTNRKIPIMASGGIFTAEDANEKIEAGATLVQVWTGFIYVGPSIAKRICKSIF
ncbi:MAG: quinone-dependent dihydroorotate dehydrogenase [Bacteroidetes bacterium]|nr:quinone-dependent dihydroorotate dehydrogenase [Bacteroidota bacterium]